MNAARLKSWLWKNPVVVKDLRTRMRGGRTYLLVTANLVMLLLGLIAAFLVYRTALTTTGNLEQRATFGKVVFGMLVFLELAMVSFIAPAMTSGAISSEHERQTYDLIRVTLLPARQLVLGKFLPGLSFVFLQLFTSLPLYSPSFLIGGVTWREIVMATVILLTTATAFCALGLLLSALTRRTVITTAIAYASTIFLVFGIPFIMLVLLLLGANIVQSSPNNFRTELAMMVVVWLAACLTPTGVIIGTEAGLLQSQNLFILQFPLSSGETIHLPAPWMIYVAVYLLFSLTALLFSVERVKEPDV